MTFTSPTNPRPMPDQPSTKPRRSATTTDPISARHKATTSRGLRVKDLFRAFMARLDASDVIAQAGALRCAELTVACEDLRQQIMDADLASADEVKLVCQAKLAEQLIRLENLADRAERRLANLVDEEWNEAREAERQAKAEAEHQAKQADRPPIDDDLLDPVKIYARQKREREARERGETA
jgi:hypothetical protein